MQLMLDDYGVHLEKDENMFAIKLGEQVRSISPVKITAIHIFKTATVSTAALLMAADYEIPVLLYDSSYKPAVRVWKSNFSSTGTVRVMQPLFCESAASMYWCKKLLVTKLNGQLQHISHISNRWPAQKESCDATGLMIKKSLQQITGIKDDPALAASLRGLEGIATAGYWQLLQALLEKEIFKKREQKNPTDKFNPCINYLYGILYGKIEGALLAYGLDPMVGMMHAEGYSKKSLVYDCMEPFRPWAEMLVVNLFKNKTLQTVHFEYRETEVRLAKEGRKILAEQFIKMLNEKTLMNNRRITRNDQVFFVCSQLAQAVKNYKPENK